MKIFISGAGGFIGRHLVKKLTSDGHTICINTRNLKKVFDQSIDMFRIDENNIQSTINFFKVERFDGVIHLASLYLTTHKSDDVISLIDTNVRFSSVLLEAAVQAGIPWFINTGTFWQHYNNKDYSPVNLYAATKQAFESIAQYYVETESIKFVSLHLSDTYGPDDTRPKIFNLWERIAKTGEILDMSPGEQILDISHVDHVTSCYANLSELLYKNDVNIKNGAQYAVKATKRYTLRELAEKYEVDNNVKLNINWGGKPYRNREVMIAWENGIKLPQ